jgi:hypothetical protein
MGIKIAIFQGLVRMKGIPLLVRLLMLELHGLMLGYDEDSHRQQGKDHSCEPRLEFPWAPAISLGWEVA